MDATDPSKTIELIITESGQASRLDHFLAHRLETSRSRIQDWIRLGFVRLDNQETKPSFKLKSGQRVSITIPALLPAIPQPDPTIPLTIVYEDSDLLVIDKQAGLVVHPAPGNPEGTLVHALLAHANDWSGIGGVSRPGIVHRLDKDTSGLMVIAKNDSTHLGLQQQFQDRTVHKLYQALVFGIPQPREGRINQPIGRHPKDRLRMAIVPSGKPAVSDYQVLETYGSGHALVEVQLHTGRTHQIRVHLAWLGFPLIGDPLYGRTVPSWGMTGQALHCCALAFKHPSTQKPLGFKSPLPQAMQTVRQAMIASSP